MTHTTLLALDRPWKVIKSNSDVAVRDDAGYLLSMIAPELCPSYPCSSNRFSSLVDKYAFEVHALTSLEIELILNQALKCIASEADLSNIVE
jgi:hypothetical protein